MRPRRPRTYEADHAGRKVRVTVPENDEQELFDAAAEQLSPQAVAAVIAFLQPVAPGRPKTNNPAVDAQLRWLVDGLTELLGGRERAERLAREVGL